MAARSKQLDPSAVPLRNRDGKTNLWAVMARLTQLLLLLGVVALVFLFFSPIWLDLAEWQSRREKADHQIEAANERTAAYLEEIEFLKHSPEYVERQARERLNLGRPGEVIFRFDSYQTSRELNEATRTQ